MNTLIKSNKIAENATKCTDSDHNAVFIGIDMTSKMAHMKTGMGNSLNSFLAGLSFELKNSRILIFATKDNYKEFLVYANSQIQVIVTTPVDITNYLSRLDLLHFPFNEISLSTKSVPSVVTVNDLIPEHFPDKFSDAVREKLRATCNNADYIITISQYTKDDIERRYNIPGDKISVAHIPIRQNRVYRPIELDIVRTKLKLPSRFILYPATGRPHKNHENLIKALRNIAPDVYLVLITGEITGEKQDQRRLKDLERLAVQHGVTERVLVYGYVSLDDYWGLLRLAEALVFPSLAEGFGIPVIEAMLASCPVVCSNSTCLPEIAGQAALFFDPYDPNDIAEKVNALLDNEDLKASLIQKGHDNAERFGVEIACGLLKSYQEAVEYIDNRRSENVAKSSRKPETTSQLPIRSLLSSGNILFRHRYFEKAKIAYEKSIQAGKNVFSEGYSTSLEYNICTCIKRQEKVATRSDGYELIVLLDCTRLFTNNPESGISRYCIRLLDYLMQEERLFAIPFYNSKSRGFVSPKHEYSTYVFDYDSRLYDILLYESALSLSRSFKLPIVYHSPYHPLPEKRDPKFKYCLTICDVAHLTHPEYYPGAKNYITNDIVRSINPETDEILAISKFTGMELIRLLKNNMSVTFAPLAPYTKRSHNIFGKSKQERKSLLIPFQNDPRKGFDRMLKVGLKWLTMEQESRVIIFGKTDNLSESAKNQIGNSKSISERIELVHLPSDEQLQALFNRSFAFLYLSLLEGFGMPPLEAMQHDCLPILFANTSLAEVYSGWEYMLDPTVSDEFIVKKIVETQRESSNKAEVMCQEMLDRYSWELTCATHVAAYLKALESKS